MVVLNYCRKGLASLDSKRCKLHAADLLDVFKSHVLALVEPSYARLHFIQNAMTLIGLVRATDCR